MIPHIALDNFQGPIDLLVQLIHEKEIDVYNVPIAAVTRQFLKLLGDHPTLRLDVGAEFLGSASSLLLLKSKRLLPIEEEPQVEGEEDPQALMKRLIEYAAFKEIAERLGELDTREGGQFCRGLALEWEEEPPIDSGAHDLEKLLQSLLCEKPKDPPTIIKAAGFLVSERIEFLKQTLVQSSSLPFSALFTLEKSRDELIATFLALLQLLKTQEVKILFNNDTLLIEACA